MADVLNAAVVCSSITNFILELFVLSSILALSLILCRPLFSSIAVSVLIYVLFEHFVSFPLCVPLFFHPLGEARVVSVLCERRGRVQRDFIPYLIEFSLCSLYSFS